jgi:hypothetical protein
MAAPNLKTPTTIIGKTAGYAVTTSLAAALSNSAASGKVFKVNVVRAANLTTGIATVDLTVFRSATDTYIIKSASVAPNSSLVLIDRNEYLYLEEGDALRAGANAISTIDLTIHYEEIT